MADKKGEADLWKACPVCWVPIPAAAAVIQGERDLVLVSGTQACVGGFLPLVTLAA